MVRALVFVPSAFIAVSLAFGGCGRSDSTSPGSRVTPVPSPSEREKPRDGGDSSSGKRGSFYKAWRSDVDESFIEACSKGQTFARGKCWDSVHFGPSGVSLRSAGEIWSAFENGAPVSQSFKSTHVYVRSEDGRNIFQNVGVAGAKTWLASLLASRAVETQTSMFAMQGEYLFLPEEVGIARFDAEIDPVGRSIETISFRLNTYAIFSTKDRRAETVGWQIEGTVQVCKEFLQLSELTQGRIETVCGTGPFGDSSSVGVSIPNGQMIFELLPSSGSDPAGRQPHKISYKLDFSAPVFE